MKHVTNKEFESALNDEEVRKIMNSSSKRFNTMLDDEEIRECQLDSLWYALGTYEEGKSKFFTYLHNMVRFYCLKSINLKKKKSPEKTNISISPEAKTSNFNLLETMSVEDSLSEKEYSIIEDRFIGQLNLKEIGEKYKISNPKKEINRIITKLN